MKKCRNCGSPLPEQARFCFVCGAKQQDDVRREPVGDFFNFKGDLEKQLKDRFFKALKQRVAEEHQSNQFNDYSERLYESGFRDTVQLRSRQLAEELNDLWDDGDLEQREAAILSQDVFEELLDFFIIHFCKDLNEVYLPEAILQYQSVDWNSIDLFQMIMDYLALDQERETYYTNFLLMPIDKLKNAGKSFLFPQKKEKILLIADQSILGSLKEGFALTEAAIYWKTHLEKPKKVYFDTLDEIRKQKEWITINGNFFSVNKGTNLRMLKLLKKIRNLQRKLF